MTCFHVDTLFKTLPREARMVVGSSLSRGNGATMHTRERERERGSEREGGEECAQMID